MLEIYACPVCAERLVRLAKGYQCPVGHTYDLAKSGYVNLVLANQKRSKNPGYDKGMIRSRREFLAKGYYDAIGLQLATILCDAIPEQLAHPSTTILDVGCADGYFSDQIRQQLPDSVHLWGIDLSKIAIQYAAQRYQAIRFAVANSFRLPILPNSLDLILQILAPGNEAEYARTLKKGGYLVTITPNTEHLWQMREVIYERPNKHQPKEEKRIHFVQQERVTIRDTITLDNQDDIRAIFQMTPYYWRASKAGREKVELLTTLRTQIDLMVTIYQNIE